MASLMGLGMGLLLLDFISKAYIYYVLPFFQLCAGSVCLQAPFFFSFGGVDFQITPTINRGAAWGLFADFQFVLLAVRLVVILGIFIYLFFMNRNRAYDLPLTLVCAGAIGNVLDFFLYGFVVDFLHFNLWGYHFPIFNFADTFITVGVAALFIINLVPKKDVRVKKNYSSARF